MINAGAAMRTNIDDLTERIEIVYYPTTQDTAGNLINGTETSRGTCWAKVLPVSAAIADGYNENANEIKYRITVRFRTDIEPTDIVKWRGKKLALLSPAYDAESRKVWTTFDCRELVEDG